MQAAILEENAKQRELYNLRKQMEEDSQAERELQQIQAQAKAAQLAQEETINAREALTKRLDQSRRLKQLQTDVELAKLVSCMLSANDTSSSHQPFPATTGSMAPATYLASTADLRLAAPQAGSCPDNVMSCCQPDPMQSSTVVHNLEHSAAAVSVSNNTVTAVPAIALPITTHQASLSPQQSTVTQVTELTPAVPQPQPSNAIVSSQPVTQPTMQPQAVPYYRQLPSSHPSLISTNAAQSTQPIADHRWEQPPANTYPLQAPFPAPAPYPGLQPQLGADLPLPLASRSPCCQCLRAAERVTLPC